MDTTSLMDFAKRKLQFVSNLMSIKINVNNAVIILYSLKINVLIQTVKIIYMHNVKNANLDLHSMNKDIVLILFVQIENRELVINANQVIN